MKHQHTQIISELIAHESRFNAHIAEYQRIAQDQKRSGDAHLLANEFAQEALALLVPMAELLSPPKAWGARSALSGKETGTAGEARAHTTLKRLARQLQHRN
jgi:hypothetical protein